MTPVKVAPLRRASGNLAVGEGGAVELGSAEIGGHAEKAEFGQVRAAEVRPSQKMAVEARGHDLRVGEVDSLGLGVDEERPQGGQRDLATREQGARAPGLPPRVLKLALIRFVLVKLVQVIPSPPRVAPVKSTTQGVEMP